MVVTEDCWSRLRYSRVNPEYVQNVIFVTMEESL